MKLLKHKIFIFWDQLPFYEIKYCHLTLRNKLIFSIIIKLCLKMIFVSVLTTSTTTTTTSNNTKAASTETDKLEEIGMALAGCIARLN